MRDWTSVRIERATLNRLNEEKWDTESHDDLLNRLLDAAEGDEASCAEEQPAD